MNESLENLLKRAASRQRQGRGVMACLVAETRGSTPQAAGALMLVDDEGQCHGTIGGGCLEAEVRRRAGEMLRRGTSGLLRLDLDHELGWDDGLLCGGSVELALAAAPPPERLDQVVADLAARRATSLDLIVDPGDGPEAISLVLPPRPRLYIAGAGHLGQAVARQALALEFDVTVFDDRADLLERHVPSGARTVAGDIAASIASAPIDETTWCLIATRGHRHDERALAAAVGRGARYVGMLGSRRKASVIFDGLIARGVAPGALSAVHSPVGLPIGAMSVEEIAVSIAAELVQVRRSADGAEESGRRVVRRPAAGPAAVP